ncbi:F-box/kelch-repeat protein At3g23880-like [Trifolium pratense]|uniref:F-box/kelch-repeat protein At3g23880-like n=1 Tax=Trifolium pratense TaxID=57577 RepID=UPI001E6951FE|nr:F-box/kelch-repeat protein At3g23880-like [Trifolium pratense]
MYLRCICSNKYEYAIGKEEKKCITLPSTVVLPHDLIVELLSYLPVKSLVRFRSVCKSWKTVIYDPTFVKLHLKRSPTRNPLFTLTTYHVPRTLGYYYSVIPYPISRFIENRSFNLSVDPYYSLEDKECSHIVGTCNGLICLSHYSYIDDQFNKEFWLRLWNPATRTISPQFGYFRGFYVFDFKFGYDNSTGKYKVVAFRYHNQKSNVRILSFGDNVWRDIEGLPAVPVHLHFNYHEHAAIGCVYLCGSLNWLAIHNINEYNYKDITVGQFLIVSLDLGTETYNQYMLPRRVDGVLSGTPTVSVLGGCLCFSYSYKETDFVIWQMKKFGVEDSWTQFLKISFHNLQVECNFSKPRMMHYFELVPLFLSENGDTLALTSIGDSNAILYNLSDNRVEQTKFTAARITTSGCSTSNITCWYMAMDFVESLVSTF